MQPSGGRIWFEGRDITRLKPNVCCKLGIARSFQIPQPFSTLTVLENIEVALEFGHHKRPADTSRAYAWLERVGLARWVNVPAAQLPLGARKKLEMVRALATEPKVILLDEVMAGLSAEETEEVAEIVRGLKKENIAVIFVEHVLRAVMTIAERIIVSASRPTDRRWPASRVVARDPAVIEAYLGGALEWRCSLLRASPATTAMRVRYTISSRKWQRRDRGCHWPERSAARPPCFGTISGLIRARSGIIRFRGKQSEKVPRTS